MAKKSDDFQRIKGQIEQHQYAPVYLLHGEEAFFIDQLANLLLDTVIWCSSLQVQASSR